MRRPLVLSVLALLLAVLVWQGSASFATREAASRGPRAPRPAAVEVAGEDLDPADGSAPDDARTQVAGRATPDLVAPDARAVSTTTGSLLLRAALPDGTPVAGVSVFVLPRQGARLGHGTSEHITDDEGLARAANLAAGRVTLYCPNGPFQGAEVVAGVETEVLLEFTQVVDVHGVVRDPEGQPVAGADVWLASLRRDWLGTRHMTRTGPTGEFLVRHVSRERSLGATAKGLGPSALVDLELVDSERSPVEIELVLAPAGGGLVGRVLDPAGGPVGGARVAVGDAPREYSMRHDGTGAESWGARVEVTDAGGHFAFEGLAAGVQPLYVAALEFPEHRGEVEVPAGGTARQDVRLGRGMGVRGVVRDEQGRAVAHAIVLALDAPFVDPFPTQGPTEKGAPFHRPATRSDDGGGYLLDRLPPGEVHLYASRGTSYWDDGDFLGTVQETLTGAAGQTLEWHPVLSPGHLIRGRVTYADGQPMGNVFVSATDADGRRYSEDADGEGRFILPGLEQRAYRVSVQLWDPPDGARPLEQEDVWPSASELLLSASFSKVTVERGVARVRIDDRAGCLEGRGGVVFAYPRGWYFSEEVDGVFSARLPPDRYQARAMRGDVVVGASEWFDLAPGEERDLGSIVTRAGGSLVVRVQRPPELAGSSAFVSIETDHTSRQGARELPAGQDELTFADLLEGPATLTLGGPGLAIESRKVEVRAGSTPVDFQLRPAREVLIHVSASPSAGFGDLELVILRADGGLYATLDYHERGGARLPLEARPHVPEGRFTVRASTTSGLTASGELVVGSGQAQASVSLVLE